MDGTYVSPSFQRKQNSDARAPLKKDDCHIQYGGISSEDNVQLMDSDNASDSKCMKIYSIVTTLTLEPALFGFMFAYLMNVSCMTNLMIDKGCLYHMNYSHEICENLTYHKAEKKSVEMLANDYSVYVNLTSFIAAFLMTFIAPWSDKYGRRVPLLVAIFGATLTDIGIILCIVFFESRLGYLVLARLPSEFTGGFICMLALIFSHASETSSEKNRTLKYTSVEIALGLGMALGALTGGFLYRYYGYFYVYMSVAVAHGLCFLYTLFFVEETVGLDINMKWHEKAKDFFSCKNFKSSIITTCRAREGKARTVILLLLLSMCIIVLNYEAFSSIAYVYVHHVYDWDPSMYGIANTTAALIGLLTTVVLAPFLIRVFKFRDYSLGIIGAFSFLMRDLLIAFSKYHTYLYYIGLGFGLFSSLSSLAVRSGISKIVSKDELGQVFAFLATCEAVIPMLGTVAVTQIFNSTIDIFPNITYMIGAVLLIIPLLSFTWALKITKNPYSSLSVSANDQVKEKA